MNSEKLGSFPYKSGFPTCLAVRYSFVVLGLFPVWQWAWGWPSVAARLARAWAAHLALVITQYVCVCVWEGEHCVGM